MGREGLGLTCKAARITHWMGLPANFPRDCLQPSILALKGQGTFHHIRKTALLVSHWGKAAGLSV